MSDENYEPLVNESEEQSGEPRTISITRKSQMPITIYPEQAKIINRLLRTGLYGRTANQAVSRLLDQMLILHAENFTKADQSSSKNHI